MAVLGKGKEVSSIQEFLIDEVIGNAKVDLGAQAKGIGNKETGRPDGLLGENTATALQTLMLRALMSVGVDPETAKKDTSYNEQNRAILNGYLSGLGIDADKAAKFVQDAAALESNAKLQQAYKENAKVDIEKLKTEFKPATDEQPATPAAATQDTPATSAPSFNGAATAAPSTEIVRSVTISLDTFKELKSKVEAGTASDQVEMLVKACEEAQAKARKESGVEDKVARMEEIGSPHGGTYLRAQQDALSQQADAIESQLENFKVKDANGADIAIGDKKLTLDLGGGQTKTMSYNEFKEKHDGIFGGFFDNADEKRLREAMEKAFDKLKADSGYTALETKLSDVQKQAQELPNTLADEYFKLQKEVRDMNMELRTNTLNVTLPKELTDQQIKSILPDTAIQNNIGTIKPATPAAPEPAPQTTAGPGLRVPDENYGTGLRVSQNGGSNLGLKVS